MSSIIATGIPVSREALRIFAIRAACSSWVPWEKLSRANYAGIIEDLHVGDEILLDDGLIRLEVLELAAPDIRCRVCSAPLISDESA